jgi:hypothetical protein
LGRLVEYSSLRNSVFIYAGLKGKLISTFVNLLPFGMVVEKNLMGYFKDQFIDLVCEDIEDFENFK